MDLRHFQSVQKTNENEREKEEKRKKDEYNDRKRRDLHYCKMQQQQQKLEHPDILIVFGGFVCIRCPSVKRNQITARNTV